MCLDPGWMRNLKAVVYSRWVWKPGRSVALGEGPGVPGFWVGSWVLVEVLDETERSGQEGGHLASGYGLVGAVTGRVGCASCGYPRCC